MAKHGLKGSLSECEREIRRSPRNGANFGFATLAPRRKQWPRRPLDNARWPFPPFVLKAACPASAPRLYRPSRWRAVSSAGEHYVDIVGVTSSILVPPTIPGTPASFIRALDSSSPTWRDQRSAWSASTCVDGPQSSRCLRKILAAVRMRSCVRPLTRNHCRWPRWVPRATSKQRGGHSRPLIVTDFVARRFDR